MTNTQGRLSSLFPFQKGRYLQNRAAGPLSPNSTDHNGKARWNAQNKLAHVVSKFKDRGSENKCSTAVTSTLQRSKVMSQHGAFPRVVSTISTLTCQISSWVTLEIVPQIVWVLCQCNFLWSEQNCSLSIERPIFYLWVKKDINYSSQVGLYRTCPIGNVTPVIWIHKSSTNSFYHHISEIDSVEQFPHALRVVQRWFDSPPFGP
jgi:hypothetical protein